MREEREEERERGKHLTEPAGRIGIGENEVSVG